MSIDHFFHRSSISSIHNRMIVKVNILAKNTFIPCSRICGTFMALRQTTPAI